MVNVELLIGNDCLLKVTGLKNRASGGGWENSAAVSYVIKDDAGSQIASGSASYVAASNGDYEGTVADTVSLTVDQFYDIEITADAGAGKKGFWRYRRKAKYRQ